MIIVCVVCRRPVRKKDRVKVGLYGMFKYVCFRTTCKDDALKALQQQANEKTKRVIKRLGHHTYFQDSWDNLMQQRIMPITSNTTCLGNPTFSDVMSIKRRRT